MGGGREPEYLEKIPDNKHQKTSHTKAGMFKPQTRLELIQVNWHKQGKQRY